MKEETRTLYSLRAISLATFFGGPLAASYLVKRNFEAFGKDKQGRNALIMGIAFTVAMFGLLFSLPEEIADKIPNFILPVIYTGIIALLVEWKLGARMHKHADEGGEFHSLWKAFFVGLVFLVILMAGVFSTVFVMDKFSTADFDTVAYDEALARFTANEEKSLAVFNQNEITDPEELKKELLNGLLLWTENKGIITELAAIENLPKKAIRQNELLLEYCELRIELNQLALQSINDESPFIYEQMDEKARDINELMTQIKQMNAVLF